MNKAYERINWENYPSENTALNEANLNKMDAALNEVDNRVVAHETTKLDKATANSMVKDVDFDETTGIFTIAFLNGVTKTLDTKLEKIATNFRYDYETQKLILTLVDGTTQEIDMSALITQYEFENSAYINWTVVDGKVKAEIINGSITADKLQPNFLADVTIQANNAKMSADNAKTSEQNAKQSELKAKEYVEIAGPITSSITGVNPTLDNSTGAPIIHLKGYGKTEQQTYAGKNLCPLGSESSTLFINIPIDHLTDGNTYTLSCIIDSTDTDDTLCSVYKYGAKNTLLVYSPRNTRESIAFIKETGDNAIRVYASVDYNTSTGDTVTVSDIQIELGNTATDFEPYVGGTASPNPEYPQPIIGVGDGGYFDGKLENGDYASADGSFVSSTVKLRTVNKIPVKKGDIVVPTADKVKVFYAQAWNTSGGHIGDITSGWTEIGTPITIQNDGFVTFTFKVSDDVDITPQTAGNISVIINGKYAIPVKTTGKNVFDINKRLLGTIDNNGDLVLNGSTSTFYRYNFKENTQYTFSGYVKNSNASANVRFAVAYTDGTKDNVIMLNETTEYKYREFTTDAGKTIERVYIDYSSQNSMYIKGGELQIEEGTTATPYEPYTETTANIPLTAPLYEGDYIEYNMDGSGDEYRKMKSVVYDGSNDEAWVVENTGNVSSAYILLNDINKAIICDRFTEVGSAESLDNKINHFVLWSHNSAFNIYLPVGVFTDYATFKAWLAQNPITVVYEKAEPTVTPLTAEQIAEFDKLRTFDGTTHVTCEAESEIQYFYDSVNGKAVAMIANMLKK